MIGFATASNTSQEKLQINLKAWLRPTFSPEHGVLLVLFGSVLTGSALAQAWNYCTTLALICAFFALQAEHPLVVQIKQRSTWKPRFLIWSGIYGTIAIAIAIWLWLQSPVLLWVYAVALMALIADVVAVFHKKHKSILNELVIFAAICLSTPLAYGATTHSLCVEAISSQSMHTAIAIWLLNTLFFSSAIFSIKLRRKRTSSLMLGTVYHGVASVIVAGLYFLGWLNIFTALAFVVALIKFAVVIIVRRWYCQAKFQHIALFETRFALLYIAIAAISVLPAHLPNV